MARLTVRLLAAAMSLWPGTVRADPVDRWSAEIGEASSRFGIPRDWIRRVMRAESGGLNEIGGAPVISRAGAMGLMQLMPGTWGNLRVQLGLGPNPHDPRDNILAGTAYLRLMYDRFGYPGVFGAYNAGPRRFAAFLSGQSSLPAETHAYVRKVAGDTRQMWRGRATVSMTNRAERRGGESAPDPLFAIVRSP